MLLVHCDAQIDLGGMLLDDWTDEKHIVDEEERERQNFEARIEDLELTIKTLTEQIDALKAIPQALCTPRTTLLYSGPIAI